MYVGSTWLLRRHRISAVGKTALKPNQRVIITIMDDFVDAPQHAEAERLEKIERLSGSFSEYSDPALTQKEKGAWERAATALSPRVPRPFA